MLKDKVILVTGVGKGIGLDIVKLSVKYGAYVYGITRSKKDLKEFKYIKNCQIFIGDVKKKNIFLKVLNKSKKDNKKINGLVNNAGIRQRKEFNKISSKDLKEVFDNNFFSIFYSMQIFSNYLIKNKLAGSIVNIGSIVGQRGFENLSGYASSKTAVEGLTKSFAIEMSKKNIRANIINPGFIKTSYYKNFKNKNKKLYNWTLGKIPQKKWGEVSDVSELVCFLLSNKSKYITGSSLNTDGGWLSN
tara:strand:+ start:3419 stop:4156 length:738 start_codon:yes stop_codon:yes gene_type:complete